MSLVAQIRAWSARHPTVRIALPFARPTQSFALAWLETDSADAWDDYPELDDVADELAGYAPLADVELGDDEHQCVVVARAAPHAVYVFDDGFVELAPSLDAFFADVALTPGTLPPATMLEAACEAASARIDANDPAGAIAILVPALANHPRARAGGTEALADLVARGWTDLGFAHHAVGDDRAAADAYAIAVAWGSEPARSNLLTLAIDAGRWGEARSHAETLLASFKPPEELTALRTAYARVLAALDDLAVAEQLGAQHADYLRWLATSDRPKAEALQARFVAALDEAASASPSPIFAAVRAPVAVPLPAPAPPGEVAPADIATAVRLVRSMKSLQLRSLFRTTPALIHAPEVSAALRELPDSEKAKDIRRLVAELEAKS